MIPASVARRASLQRHVYSSLAELAQIGRQAGTRQPGGCSEGLGFALSSNFASSGGTRFDRVQDLRIAPLASAHTSGRALVCIHTAQRDASSIWQPAAVVLRTQRAHGCAGWRLSAGGIGRCLPCRRRHPAREESLRSTAACSHMRNGEPIMSARVWAKQCDSANRCNLGESGAAFSQWTGPSQGAFHLSLRSTTPPPNKGGQIDGPKGGRPSPV